MSMGANAKPEPVRRYAKAYLDILARRDLEHIDKNILILIGMLSQKTGMAWPSISTFAGMLGVSVWTVKRRLRKLVARNEVVKQYRHDSNGVQLSNFYSPPPYPQQPATPSTLQGEQPATPIRQEQKIRQDKKEKKDIITLRDQNSISSKNPEPARTVHASVDAVGVGTPQGDSLPVGNAGDSPQDHQGNGGNDAGLTGIPKSPPSPEILKACSKDALPIAGTSPKAIELVRALALASDRLFPGCRFPVSNGAITGQSDYWYAQLRVGENPELNPAELAERFLIQFVGKVNKRDFESRKLIRFSAFSQWLYELVRQSDQAKRKIEAKLARAQAISFKPPEENVVRHVPLRENDYY